MSTADQIINNITVVFGILLVAVGFTVGIFMLIQYGKQERVVKKLRKDLTSNPEKGWPDNTAEQAKREALSILLTINNTQLGQIVVDNEANMRQNIVYSISNVIGLRINTPLSQLQDAIVYRVTNYMNDNRPSPKYTYPVTRY